MRYFIRFSYNGTNYHGSQVQPNGNTVQAELERALSLLLRTPISTTFAGRTDAGVHAETMYAHFDYPSIFDTLTTVERQSLDTLSHLVFRLNGVLPADIAVQEIRPVRDDAHARFDATSRTYEYRIIDRKDVFCPNTRTRVRPGLNFNAMNEAARHLLGRQDFASFCRAHTDVKTTICNVTHAEWRLIADSEKCNHNTPSPTKGRAGEGSGERAGEGSGVFTITADRFLRNMVRAVVGTLFDVGYGKIKPDDVRNIIRSQSRQSAGQSAPAEGLFLTDITYPSELFL